jgi:acetyl esterase
MVTLDPEAAAFLERAKQAGAPLPHEVGVEQARAGHEASAPTMAGPGEPVDDVSDAVVGDAAAGVDVRIYRPVDARGVVVYAHGGGWATGTLDTYDTLCRALANRARATVVSVGYTLAPDAVHPAQLDQVLAVLDWSFGADGPAPGEPVVVAGDSAGGFLGGWVAAAEKDRLAGQVTIYPAFDPSMETGSAEQNASGYYLERTTMRWYWDLYAPEGVSVLSAADLPGLPPALVVTAGFDPLRDDGRAYADALERSGVEVVRIEYPGQIHGFVRMTALMPQALDALDRIGVWLQARFRA